VLRNPCFAGDWFRILISFIAVVLSKEFLEN
jgi:hypothetical protein